MRRLQHLFERKTGILLGTYRWHDGPIFYMSIGATRRVNTVFEIGLFGRCIFIAPVPSG